MGTSNRPVSPSPRTPRGRRPGSRPAAEEEKRGLIITLVAVLVLALGGGATWWALSRSDSVASGAATPEDAVTELLSALDDGDLLGAANTLAPSEASILADQLTQSFDEYKRLGLLDQNADPSSFSGFELVAENLTFDSQSAERVNDHVTITKLTGGNVTINADLTKLPLAQEYLDAMLAEAGGAAALTDSETLDIGSHVQQTGEPIPHRHRQRGRRVVSEPAVHLRGQPPGGGGSVLAAGIDPGPRRGLADRSRETAVAGRVRR